jgi:hypothetical protein
MDFGRLAVYSAWIEAATGHPVAKGVDFMRADIVPGAVFPDYELTRAQGEMPESLFLSVEIKLLS